MQDLKLNWEAWWARGGAVGKARGKAGGLGVIARRIDVADKVDFGAIPMGRQNPTTASGQGRDQVALTCLRGTEQANGRARRDVARAVI